MNSRIFNTLELWYSNYQTTQSKPWFLKDAVFSRKRSSTRPKISSLKLLTSQVIPVILPIIFLFVIIR